MKEKDEKEKKEDGNKVFWTSKRKLIVSGCGLAIVVVWFILCTFFSCDAAAALFSALAFAGMIVALWMQKFELDLQYKEIQTSNETSHKQWEAMEHQWNEMKEQKNIMAETLKQANISRLEDLIYKTIDQHNNVINNLSGEIKGRKYEKTEFLEMWAEIHIIEEGYQVDYTGGHFLGIGKEDIMVFDKNFLYLAMSKCINVILPIIKQIDKISILNDDDAGKEFDNRHKYYSWIMGSISYSELYLLKEYYWDNALYSDFKRISEKYGLLEGIRLHEGKSQDNDPAYYPNKAKEKYVNARASLIQ